MKRPDLADAGSPDDAAALKRIQPTRHLTNEKHDAAPETKQEDLQLKRALELFACNKPAAAQKTA